MSDTLQTILATKRNVIARDKQRDSYHNLEQRLNGGEMAAPKGFIAALKRTNSQDKPALIAELKKASPSKGIIRNDFEPVALAKAYEEGGATCLSVLTDEEYFSGCNAYLQDVAKHSPLPTLRKDFIIDPYQIIQARTLGADAVLLIMAALADNQASELESLAHTLGMDVLVEVHDAQELMRALMHMNTPLIGINNRNLKTLEVNIHTSVELMADMPADKIVVCESGIGTYKDITAMRRHGMHCFLVGESLMRQHDVRDATQRLLYGS